MKENWQTKIIIIGAIVGAVTGIVGASILIQTAIKAETRPQITAGDGVKVGLGVLAVLRLLADLGTR
jgi:TRAP-type mannitol/chloroaromatic compound transport system permease large subunit